MRPINRKELNRRLQMYEQGYSFAQIARECGVSRAAITIWFKRYGYLAGERRVIE